MQIRDLRWYIMGCIVLLISFAVLSMCLYLPVKGKIVNSIQDLSKELNLEIIAEGIENKEAAVYIKEHGVGIGSGYYFSEPLSTDDFTEYVAQLKMKEQLAETAKLKDQQLANK